jgi:hypothetical protein
MRMGSVLNPDSAHGIDPTLLLRQRTSLGLSVTVHGLYLLHFG